MGRVGRVNGTTRVLAVLGDPVAHSLSPAMYNAAIHVMGLDAIYVAFHVPLSRLDETAPVLGALALAGNATTPLKERLFELVARPTERCAQIAACNAFWTEDGALAGDNTDIVGIERSLDALGVEGPGTGPWLLLGTGGAARAVAAVARSRTAELSVRSRTADRARAFSEWAGGLGVRAEPAPERSEAPIVINATPRGLHGNDPLPITPAAVPACRVALDLVYARGGTRWVAEMAAHGARALDGRVMLVEQGIASFERFFPGQRPPREVMRWAVERALAD